MAVRPQSFPFSGGGRSQQRPSQWRMRAECGQAHSAVMRPAGDCAAVRHLGRRGPRQWRQWAASLPMLAEWASGRVLAAQCAWTEPCTAYPRRGAQAEHVAPSAADGSERCHSDAAAQSRVLRVQAAPSSQSFTASQTTAPWCSLAGTVPRTRLSLSQIWLRGIVGLSPFDWCLLALLLLSLVVWCEKPVAEPAEQCCDRAA